MPYITSIERSGIAKGLKQGLEQGLEQGQMQGQMQGLQRGRQESVLELLELRFGNFPEEVRQRLETISDQEVLRSLLKEAALAATLEDFLAKV